MSIGHFALSAASVAAAAVSPEKVPKSPPKRRIAALRDRTIAPEPR